MPYYLYRENRISGPYKLADIQSWAGSPDTLICEEDAGLPDGRWCSLTDLFGGGGLLKNSFVNQEEASREDLDELEWAIPFFKNDSKKIKDDAPQFSQLQEKLKGDWFNESQTPLFGFPPQRPEFLMPQAPVTPAQPQASPPPPDFEQILKRYLDIFEERLESLKEIRLANISSEKKDNEKLGTPPVKASPAPTSVNQESSPPAPPLAFAQMPPPPVFKPAPIALKIQPLAPVSPPQTDVSPEKKDDDKVETLPVQVSLAEIPANQEPPRADENGGELHFQMGESFDSAEATDGLNIQMGDSFEVVEETPAQEETQNITLRPPAQFPQETETPMAVSPSSAESAQPLEQTLEQKPVELESPLAAVSPVAESPQIQISPVPQETLSELSAPQSASGGGELNPAPVASEIPLAAPSMENPGGSSPPGEMASFTFPVSSPSPENPVPTENSSVPGAPESLIQFSSPSDALSPGQFPPQSAALGTTPQSMLDSSLQSGQGSSAEPLITPIFNEPNSPSAFPGDMPPGFGAPASLEAGAPSPFQSSPDSQELLNRFAKPEASAPDKNQTKKSSPKKRSKILPVLGLGAVALAAVSFFLFFRNPKDISSMLSPGSNQRPLGMDQSPQTPVANSQSAPSLPMSSAPSAATPPSVSQNPSPVSQESANAASQSPTPEAPSSPLPQSSENPAVKTVKTPSEKAIDFVKQYPLEGSAANVGSWLDYAFGADADAKQEWSAGKLSQGIYLVRYRVTFGNSSKRKAIVYLFQSDPSGEMVLGDNAAARNLLSGRIPKIRR